MQEVHKILHIQNTKLSLIPLPLKNIHNFSYRQCTLDLYIWRSCLYGIYLKYVAYYFYTTLLDHKYHLYPLTYLTSNNTTSCPNISKYMLCEGSVDKKSHLKLHGQSRLPEHLIHYDRCRGCGFKILCSKVFMRTDFNKQFNSLWPSDTIWRHRSESTLAQLLACCLMAPSHYFKQCWLIMYEVQWQSPGGNFTKEPRFIYQLSKLAWKWFITNLI